MQAPKLSIITINLNNSKGLLKTIESVVSQTYRNFEFIIIDGASKDESLQVIERFAKELTSWVSEKDSGVYNAMNKGIGRAKGDHLLFLNSGDYLNNPEVIKDVLPLLKGNDLISGDIDIYDQNSWHPMRSIDKIEVDHFQHFSLYHQATFISADLFKKYGLYNEEFKSVGDLEFFIRTLLAGNASYKHIALKISNFVADGMSNDPGMFELNKKERAKAWELNFEKNIIEELDSYRQLRNSDLMKWGRRLNKLLPF